MAGARRPRPAHPVVKNTRGQLYCRLKTRRTNLDYVLLDYDVPLKDRGRMRLKAINWPKGVYLNHGKDRNKAKAAVLSFLAKGPLPIGSESKYFNAIEFYDHVEGTQSFGTHG